MAQLSDDIREGDRSRTTSPSKKDVEENVSRHLSVLFGAGIGLKEVVKLSTMTKMWWQRVRALTLSTLSPVVLGFVDATWVESVKGGEVAPVESLR